MRYLILSLMISLWAGMALAFDGLDTPFDSKSLTGAEKRSLQAMLAHSGEYTARLDGAWGRGSQSALMRATQIRQTPSWRDVATFVRDEVARMESANWTVHFDTPSGVSYAFPAALVSKAATSNGSRYIARDNSLQIRSQSVSAPEAILTHERIRRQGTRGEADYSINRDAVFVTTVTRPNGVRIYARSERTGSRFGTVIVEWNERQARAAQLIISSIRTGRQGNINLPEGTLQRAVSQLNRGFQPIPRPADRPREDAPIPGLTLDWLDDETPAQPEPRQTSGLSATGVAFYVNNTDMIAASEAVARCRPGTLRHGDGSPIKALKSLDTLGLTLLTSDKRSRKWVYVGQTGLQRDQKNLVALGIAPGGWETRRLLQQPIQLVGNADIGRGRVRFVTSVAADPRVTGGPILDEGRVLAGIILGRVQLEGLSRKQRREVQAFSFAVTATELAGVLAGEGVMFKTQGGSRIARDADSKAAMAAIFCAT